MQGREQHIRALRLLNLSRGDPFQVSEAEDAHLDDCEECRQAITTFAVLFGKEHTGNGA